MRWHRPPLCALLALFAAARPVAADPVCHAVEIRFAPGAPGMQMVVWIEDPKGNFVDTAYITRLTGQFGLANRPGAALLKTDFRWPYGRREMVLPVWAHRRNVHYPKVMMGGVCGNSPDTLCPDQTKCAGDCEDSTIAYHSRVSSYEPFYCSPSGASVIDAMSCASKGTFAKGAYGSQGFSLYPPRADLNAFAAADSPDAMNFSAKNDLVAISQATPLAGKLLDPPVAWFPPQGVVDGDYIAWVEMSAESDFNQAHNHPNAPDSVQAWDFEGHAFLGQPSVVYRVPFHLGQDTYSNVTLTYAGYGSWDGSDGNLRPPDGTISDVPGSGAGRLRNVTDNVDTYRVKVLVGGCAHSDGGPPPPSDAGVSDGGAPPDLTMPPPTCVAPDPVTELVVQAPAATEIAVSFRTPSGGATPNRYAVRYREGDTPFTDDDFKYGNAAAELPAPSGPGAILTTAIHGVLPATHYTVGVRGVSPCGVGSHVVSQTFVTPLQKFVTLNGCFVATAAYGSPMATQVASLRRFRDQDLLHSAAGRLFVAAYYALSPRLASAIAGDRRLRALARVALRPLVDAVEANR